MARKRYVKDVRGARGELDVNDALRLAVQDERFAVALVKKPEALQGVFNLKEIEVAAIRDAVGGLGDIAGEASGWYE